MSMLQSNGRTQTLRLTQIAVLIAIMVIMAFTPLGYLKTALFEISFMTIPVVVGAIVIGPLGGLILGIVFGITSFIQCFGMSALGVALLEINPFWTFLVCMIPRALMGYVAGLIFSGLSKIKKLKYLQYGVTGLCGALLNTILFMAFFMILFGTSDYVQSMQGEQSVIAFILAMVGINGVIESVVCAVVGGTIGKIIKHIQ